MPEPIRRSGRHRIPEDPNKKPRKRALILIPTIIVAGILVTIFVVGYGSVLLLLLKGTVPPSIASAVTPTETTETFTPMESSDTVATNVDKNCPDFFDQEDAQRYYIAQGGPTSDPDYLDLDNDGRACENYPYSETPVPPSPVDTSEVNIK